MQTLNPFDAINLNGFGTFRGVTLAPPAGLVSALLPTGLALGAQTVTAEGTHPVIVSFNKLSDARMSIPSLLPTLNYREYTIGIPYTFVTYGKAARDGLGPFYYMPRLLLNSALAVMGGIGFWGYLKEMASFERSGMQQQITAGDGRKLTSLSWEQQGEHRPIDAYPFEPVKRMLDQPLVSQLPYQVGPFVVAAFDRQWDRATVRPIETHLEVQNDFVPGCIAIGACTCSAGCDSGHSLGIDTSPLGSYELRAPWRLGMPYVPFARAWR